MPEAGKSSGEDAARFEQMRSTARHLFLHALAESSIEKAFARHVHYERGVLRVADDLYDFSAQARIFVISMGKAAHTMLQALYSRVGSGLEGIVACHVNPAAQLPGFRYFLGGHPLPNHDSLRAAEAMLRSLAAQKATSLVIYMISGGGSAIVEKPIDDEISLDDLAAAYRALVFSGAPIAEINAIRKHLSAVKGGRLAQAAAPALQISILVSDVAAGTPDALASGPTMPDSTTVEECYALAARYRLLELFPASVRELFQRRALEETPKPDDAAFLRSRWWPILSEATAQKAAAEEAARAGFRLQVDNRCDDWDYARAADYLLGRLRELRRQAPRVCLVSCGEVTVKVDNGGVGGRNQQFALYCAGKIAGESFTVLSAGTDGRDGNSPAAGAIVDGSTRERARARGFDPQAALARFDAFPLFDALGDAIMTGPTGNNVRDLRILLAY